MNTTSARSNSLNGPEDHGRLPVALKLGWSTGSFGIALLMNGISGLILLFAASILGISPWLAGLVIFVSKLFDVVTDPIVGIWSDRHRGPKGRRRPFLLWGAILSSVSFAAIFATPIFGSEYLTAAYLFLALCLYALAYTIFNIPYLSMPAEMTDNYHERSSIHAYRIVFVSLGGMVGTSGFNFMLERLGKTDPESFAIIGVACAVLILITMLIAYFTTASARFTEAGEVSKESNYKQFATEFGAVTGNRNFLRLIGVKFAQLLGVQTMGAALAYFFVQFLQRDFNDLAIYGLVITASVIIFSPLLVRFSRAYGKKAAYYLAAAISVINALSWSVSGPEESIWFIYARAIIVGIAFGGNVVMAMSMLTDIINEDAERSGVRREGAFTALYSFVEKLTGAIGPLIVGVALSWVGFNKDLPFDVPQGGHVDMALLMAVSWVPAVLNVVAAMILTTYSLTEKDFVLAKERNT